MNPCLPATGSGLSIVLAVLAAGLAAAGLVFVLMGRRRHGLAPFVALAALSMVIVAPSNSADAAERCGTAVAPASGERITTTTAPVDPAATTVPAPTTTAPAPTTTTPASTTTAPAPTTVAPTTVAPTTTIPAPTTTIPVTPANLCENRPADLTFDGGNTINTRVNGPGPCGKFRVDGWASNTNDVAGGGVNWRIVFGTDCAVPSFTIMVPVSGPNWTITNPTSPSFGLPTNYPAAIEMAEHGYQYIDTSKVAVSLVGAAIAIQASNVLANDYFNLTFHASAAAGTDTSTLFTNTATISDGCVNAPAPVAATAAALDTVPAEESTTTVTPETSVVSESTLADPATTSTDVTSTTGDTAAEATTTTEATTSTAAIESTEVTGSPDSTTDSTEATTTTAPVAATTTTTPAD